ncbi:MAG: hypothetical protein RL338_1958 [Chloroflexota bacterium]
MRHLRHASLVLALAVLVTAAGLADPSAAAAHVPTAGASRGSFADLPDQLVPYRWAATTYPSWLTAAATGALAGYRNDNNSRGPRPVLATSANATVGYTGALTSPCNSVQNLQWLQCAANGGTASFRIHVRDFERAPYGDWRWWDRAATCLAATGARASGCWLIGRAMIHEAGHAIPGFGHDGQTEAETVMRSTSPQVGTAGGARTTYERCDEAALQLLWDLADLAGPYADCLDHIGGAGTSGLRTTLSIGSTGYRACTGSTAAVGGRLATATDSRYGKLSGNPLAGRLVRLDRKLRSATTWTTGVDAIAATAVSGGTNWSRALASPSGLAGTWDYRARFEGDRSLDPAATVGFSVTWSACW